MSKKIVETPLMKQYLEMKQRHPDAVLLFRVGDFYETFSDDAITTSEILGITLTRRANGAASSVELAGFPHHALDTYLPKLVRAGKRVAICEQLEDPKLTKKLVKRGITELVTPGVSINDNILENRKNNFLAAIHFEKNLCGISLLDISTGEFLVAEGNDDYIDKLLANFAPREVLVERGKKHLFEEKFTSRYLTFELDDWIYTPQSANDRLLKHFETASLKGFGVDTMNVAIIAAGAILYYLDITQHTRIGHINRLTRIEQDRYVRLDRFTVRNLELVGSNSEDGRSLLNIIDRTVSPMGARLLRRWVLFPLKDVAAINERLDIVELFYNNEGLCAELSTLISQIGDLERLISKVAVGRISPREVVQLSRAMENIEPIRQLCKKANLPALERIAEQLNPCNTLITRINNEIVADAPAALNRGQVIKEGVDSELDRLRDIAYRGKDYLLQIQKREIEETGIPSLKIGYNNVFGYYIEVTNTHKDKVPEGWIRKQTLVNAERYITSELKDYEEQILTAQDKIEVIEARLYNDLVTWLNEYVAPIQLDSSLLARLDCLSGFAELARDNDYHRPTVDDSLTLEMVNGRHPVIEKQLPIGEPYITNSVTLDNNGQQIMMITGPNMSGKSALLRSVALNVLLAQTGSFVAADKMHAGIIDKIFTRVGASDNISLGESTFMVEMNEAASILNNLSERSLVLFDELGRGTSTYDGISIAWAIVEHIHNSPLRPKTLFATHYHELNEMEAKFDRIVNFNVSVKEIDGKVVFLRKLARGGSAHSFGIHVAKLAGMPRSIVDRANVVLAHLEADRPREIETPEKALSSIGAPDGMQLTFFQLDDPLLASVRDRIIGLNINDLTPLQALTTLDEIRRLLTGKD